MNSDNEVEYIEIDNDSDNKSQDYEIDYTTEEYNFLNNKDFLNDKSVLPGIYLASHLTKEEIENEKIMMKYFQSNNGKYIIWTNFPLCNVNGESYFDTNYDDRLYKECIQNNVMINQRIYDWSNGKKSNGLYATKDFQKGEIICYYYGYCFPYPSYYNETLGETITNEMFQELYQIYNDGAYNIDTNLGYIIIPVPWCPGIYANQASNNATSYEQNGILYGEENNSYFVVEELEEYNEFIDKNVLKENITQIFNSKLMKIIASREIKAGDEIFVNYGQSYNWNNKAENRHQLPSLKEILNLCNKFIDQNGDLIYTCCHCIENDYEKTEYKYTNQYIQTPIIYMLQENPENNIETIDMNQFYKDHNTNLVINTPIKYWAMRHENPDKVKLDYYYETKDEDDAEYNLLFKTEKKKKSDEKLNELLEFKNDAERLSDGYDSDDPKLMSNKDIVKAKNEINDYYSDYIHKIRQFNPNLYKNNKIIRDNFEVNNNDIDIIEDNKNRKWIEETDVKNGNLKDFIIDDLDEEQNAMWEGTRKKEYNITEEKEKKKTIKTTMIYALAETNNFQPEILKKLSIKKLYDLCLQNNIKIDLPSKANNNTTTISKSKHKIIDKPNIYVESKSTEIISTPYSNINKIVNNSPMIETEFVSNRQEILPSKILPYNPPVKKKAKLQPNTNITLPKTVFPFNEPQRIQPIIYDIDNDNEIIDLIDDNNEF